VKKEIAAAIAATVAPAGTFDVSMLRVAAGAQVTKNDRVVVEAPLEFQLHHPAYGLEPISFGATMRTPGDDESLAAGLLFGEGIVDSAADIDRIEAGTRRPNVVNVRLHPQVTVASRTTPYRFSAGSSCGVCGTTGLDAAIARAAILEVAGTASMALSTLLQLPDRMRNEQAKFDDTGGIHAAALFDYSGNLEVVAEDVGRHNAFDKLVGQNLMKGRLPLTDRVVLLSGRVSFELVQKALRAGVSVLAAIGAPSSIAVNLALKSGLTLIGFLRDTHCNVYSNPQRITLHC